jgi:hypothetical protein
MFALRLSSIAESGTAKNLDTFFAGGNTADQNSYLIASKSE